MAVTEFPSSVLIIGSGISGLACARAAQDAGLAVRVVDRGKVAGGRLATKTLDGRPVDLGARYFTVPEGSDFSGVVDGWLARGIARPWTDTFDALGADSAWTTATGPMRYGTPNGSRSLAVDLADALRQDGVRVEQNVDVQAVGEAGSVDGVKYDTVVLAMPDPQAKRLLQPGSPAASVLAGADEWRPTLSVVAAWPERQWAAGFHGAFVNNSPVIAFVADDGDRRGDGAPVLVVHTTTRFAREYLEHPEDAVGPVIDALRALFDIAAEPSLTYAHRWTFSAPGSQHDEPYFLGGHIAVCGDAWGERSSVATAWSSGTALGKALAATAGSRDSRSVR